MQTIPYDWPWGRPEYFFTNTTIATANFGTIDVLPGSISIFAHPLVGTDPGTIEIPWSLSLGSPTTPPADPIIITQRERYYPMAADVAGQDAVRPQYVWDCMFRRFQGKILVAIFVYRVNEPGQGTPKNYSVPPNATNPQVPPVPVWLPFIDAVTGAQINNAVCALGAWDVGGLDGNINTAGDNALVAGTENGTFYNAADQMQAWQEPRQWILDQNNNVHRVLGQSREDYNASAGNVEVELVRPISFMPLLPVHFLPHPTNASFSDVVNNIWYMPLEMQADSNFNGTIDPGEPTLNMTPIYVTVREL